MSDPDIRSIADLTQQIEVLVQETKWLWWFRGHRKESWALLPFVRREYSAEQERYLAHEFRARAGLRYDRRLEYDDIANWLPLMQHYGLPTRLLDWSHSALVAAFFAAEMAMPHSDGAEIVDACIWALAPAPLNLANGLKPLRYSLNSEEILPVLRPAFYEEPEVDKVIAAMAVESDIRMQVQRGAFTVHGGRTPLEQMEGRERWLRKFRIPAEAVPRVAEELRLLGVGLADLFPDLHNLAREVKSLHRPHYP